MENCKVQARLSNADMCPTPIQYYHSEVCVLHCKINHWHWQIDSVKCIINVNPGGCTPLQKKVNMGN